MKDNRLTYRGDEGLSRFDLADIRELILRACVARGFVLTPKQFGDTETVERLLKEVPQQVGRAGDAPCPTPQRAAELDGQ